MRDAGACSYLETCLLNHADCVMVRHEAAEALGAIGAETSQKVIAALLNDDDNRMTESTLPQELRETCQLSLNLMEWRRNGGDPASQPAICACLQNPYSSVDPAPPHPEHAHLSIEEIGTILLDQKAPLYDRYQAMFSLRNLGGHEAVQLLCRALLEDTSSALLRHEVAYVLGQLQDATAVDALEESLRRTTEHKMVRHESAEALGAVEGRWEDVQRVLKEFSHDRDDVVRESCLVALDAADYWGHNAGDTDTEGKLESDGIRSRESIAAHDKAGSFAQVKATESRSE
jgi:deoxyhypusine monooxygenase